MLARAAGDSPSFVKLPVNHATTASGLNHHDYHSHTNKPPRRAARPHTGRYTRYVALHPFRTGALPTDRVHRPRQQAQTRIRTPPHAQAMHHPLLRRTTWTDIALLTRQRNAPHLAQHSHSQTQPRRASQPHRAPHPQQGTAPVMWRCTSYVALHPIRTGALPTDRVHCLRIGCSAHTHKPNRGEHPAARSLRPATVRTFTNSARNSLTATRNNTPETAGFQRSDFKS